MKLAVPAYFGNPNDTNNPAAAAYNNLVNPPPPTPPPPAGSIIVIDLAAQDDASLPDPADPNLVVPYKTQAQTYQNMGYIVLAYVDTLWGTGANCPGAASPPPGPDPNNPIPDPEGCGYKKSLPNPDRTPAKIKGYIDFLYKAIPSLDGIFFDDGPAPYCFTGGSNITSNTPIDPCVRNFYADLYQYVQKDPTDPTGTKLRPVRMGRPPVGGNPNQAVFLNASQYQETNTQDPTSVGWIFGDSSPSTRACDVATLWETGTSEYFTHNDSWSPGNPTTSWPNPLPPWWQGQGRPDQIAHVIYGCHNQYDMEQVVALCNSRGAGYVYVTDSEIATYGHLPMYWQQELSTVNTPPSSPPTNLVTEDHAPDLIYVRDWTDSSDPLYKLANNKHEYGSIHDGGLQPTPPTQPFVLTSDVWNRLDMSSGEDDLPPQGDPKPTDWPYDFYTSSDGIFKYDQPHNVEPLVASTAGTPSIDNFAFTRVSRVYPHFAGRRPVMGGAAQFLWADFGVGGNFSDLGSAESFMFASGEARQIVPASGHQWQLSPTVSPHVCLAVEVSSAGDPPTNELNGRTTVGSSGSGGTDSIVRNDRKLAQRNLAVVRVPPSPGPLPFSFCAIAYNGILSPYTMVLTVEGREEITETFGESLHIGLVSGSGRQIGGRSIADSTIELEDMQPGENRWICLNTQVQGETEGQVVPVTFHELVDGKIVNGFSVAAQISPLPAVIADNLSLQVIEFRRMSTIFDNEAAEELSRATLRVLREGNVAIEGYLHFLQSHRQLMHDAIQECASHQGIGDPFGLQAALEHLTEVIGSGEAATAAAAHNQMLQKLDASLTMQQKSEGDEADILQMVRWQRELYATLLRLKEVEGSHRIIRESDEFVGAYQARRVRSQEYPRFIGSMLHIFRRTAEAADRAGVHLEQNITDIEQHIDTPRRLQKAHREYLLKIQHL